MRPAKLFSQVLLRSEPLQRLDCIRVQRVGHLIARRNRNQIPLGDRVNKFRHSRPFTCIAERVEMPARVDRARVWVNHYHIIPAQVGRLVHPVHKNMPERALFFARAALHTAKRLGWGPEVVHASGWITAFVGHVLRTEWPGDALFEHSKVVFTPDSPGNPVVLTAADAEGLGLPADWAGRDLNDIGVSTADGAVYADASEVRDVAGAVIDPAAESAELAAMGSAAYRAVTAERDLAA